MSSLLRTLFVVLALLASAGQTRAEEQLDSATAKLYHDYLEAYAADDRRQAFYDLSKQLQDQCRADGELDRYYRVKMNEALYETEHDHPYKALRQASDMLEEMRAEGYENYSPVYTAMGIIFQSRGSILMAKHYFMDALETVDPADKATLTELYSRLAYLLMMKEPLEARTWNEKAAVLSEDYPPRHKVTIFTDAIIDFSLGNSQAFASNLQRYRLYRQQNPSLDDYGQDIMETLEMAFAGRYSEALERMDSGIADLDLVASLDMRIRLYMMMGDDRAALRTALRREHVVDSLSSDLMFDNLNEINAEVGLTSARQKAAEAREQVLVITLVLAAIIIVMLAAWGYHFIRVRRALKAKNEQLSSALAMAEESDRMKTEFVRSVSHEIRTPLNAISGFTELLWQPGLELSEEERQDMVGRVKASVEAITDIVDDMLQMADQGSNVFFPKTDEVHCNQFFSQLIYAYRTKVSANVELRYTSKVVNRQTLRCNADGVQRVVDHLLKNAVKFTTRGSITLDCRQEGKQLLLSVTDTGSGIDPDKREHIFEQFYKADSFTQGIGLGLTLSKKIAQKMGGDLTLDNDYTDGSRFVLALPMNA